MSNKILLIDDEENIILAIKKYMEKENLKIISATDGEMAIEKARKEKPDLIVLDLMLPKIDGLEVCRVLRSESSVYIIMLTAKTDELDKMVGYAMGADSYVTKPFSPKVLVAKIKAALKRINQYKKYALEDNIIRVKEIEINNKKKVCRVNDSPVELTAKEYDLLWLLAAHQNHVFSRHELLEEVWGKEFFGGNETITVHIRRLREKIEADPSNPKYIKTVWGVGYKFEIEEDD